MNNTSIDTVDFITLHEAARRLSVSKRTLHREIAAGRFPAPVKIGRASRVTLVDLELYIVRLRQAAGLIKRA